LNDKQIEYAENFDDETVDMTDFVVRLENLPLNFEYQEKENVLKAQLWKQLEDVLEEERASSNIPDLKCA
jgi:hypothetical protein